jgi:hypothetical protein
MRNNKIRETRDLHGSVYDLCPQSKAQRATGSGLTGYVNFKFISLLLAIVRIDYTIVRVIEPQGLLVVLRNGILKSVLT